MLSTDQTEMVIKVASKALQRRFRTARGAFRALEKAGYWGDQPAVEAIERLLPILKEGVLRSKDDRLRRKAIEIIEEVFFAKHTVVFDIQLPEISKDIHEISWEGILRKADINNAKPRFANRSLVSEVDGDRVLTVKCMRPKDSLENLAKEIKWMLYLKRFSFTKRFLIPEPLAFEGGYLFKLANMPIKRPKDLELHPDRYAVAFIVHRDYFLYPNSPEPSKQLSGEEIKEVMTRCAHLLGELSSLGIIHTDIIALFHSRVQAQRRLDKGGYCWWQGYVGRLDRWLDSCAWPNFGLSGIRDFEHFSPSSKSLQDLFHHIGNHLLGLFLVTGSYFRNKDRMRVGLDKNKQPVDAWYLFDKVLFKEIIGGIISSYYEGLVRKRWPQEEFMFDFDLLVERMVEEMGVDNHMVEKLRIRDQKDMSSSEFKEILKNGGYSENEICRFEQAEEDIDIITGPHLGEFNGEISLPEMIDLIRKVAVILTIDGFTGSGSSAGEDSSSLLSRAKDDGTSLEEINTPEELQPDAVRSALRINWKRVS
jgi:hypothetical protein